MATPSRWPRGLTPSPWGFPHVGVLLLGGFKGGSAADYAAGQPGDFVTRSTDHVTQVTTIQSPDRNTFRRCTWKTGLPPIP